MSLAIKLAPLLLPMLLLVRVGDCGFLDPDSALVLSRPESSRSLFGYRVGTIRNGDNIQLFITDPTAHNSVTNVTSGAVYNCSMSVKDFGKRMQSCDKQLPLNFNSTESNVFPQYFQFGASLEILSSGELIACAPGYNYEEDNRTSTLGLCGYWDSSSTQPIWVSTLVPYKADGSSDQSLYHCMGGFQIALMKFGDSIQFGVSGPLCFDNRINVWKKRGNTFEGCGVEAGQIKGFALELGFGVLGNPINKNFIFFPPRIYKADIGLLYNSCGEKPKLPIVSDMPLSDSPFLRLAYSSIYLKIKEQTAFRTVLGAPYNPDKTNTDNGCIHILYKKEKITRYNMIAQYCHSEPNGRFGTSLVNIGDINGDSFEDFVVGCPACGENGTGAVFLFLSKEMYDKSVLQPTQAVYASEVSQNLSGFGWSLAKLVGNDSKDSVSLVVGSIYSQHVVVLPGRKILHFETTKFKNVATGLHALCEACKQTSNEFVIKTANSEVVSNFRFRLLFRLLEQPYDGIERFSLNVTGTAVPVGDGWYEANNNREKTEYEVNFGFIFRSNTDNYIPISVLFRPLRVRVQLKWENRSTLDGTPFPVIQLNNMILDKYEGETELEIGIKPAENSNPDISLKLLSPSDITLDNIYTVEVILEVTKSYLSRLTGGAGIHINTSADVTIMENVEVYSNSANYTVKYWSEVSELYFADSFPKKENNFINQEEAKTRLKIKMRLSGLLANYSANFHLFTINSKAPYLPEGTKDTNPTNNDVTVRVRFNSSLELAIVSETVSSYVVDVRTENEELDLNQFSGSVQGSTIGPPLRHTYKLTAIAKPSLPVPNITMTLRVPLVTTGNELLLYFAKNMLTTNADMNNVYLPGRPYISDIDDESSSSVCEVVEPDMAQLIDTMDRTLIEEEHKVNHSSEQALSRRRRSAPTEEASSADDKNSEPLPEFDCDRPHLAPMNFRCVTFKCPVRVLIPREKKVTQDEVCLHLHARLWSPTYLNVKLYRFTITSRVSFNWRKVYYFSNVTMHNSTKSSQTFDFRSLSMKPESFPWGYIILAIFCGIWLLLLIILLLWYCNFFARKKFDYAEVPQKPTNDDDDFYR